MYLQNIVKLQMIYFFGTLHLVLFIFLAYVKYGLVFEQKNIARNHLQNNKIKKIIFYRRYNKRHTADFARMSCMTQFSSKCYKKSLYEQIVVSKCVPWLVGC